MPDDEVRDDEYLVDVHPDRDRVRNSVHWMAVASIGRVAVQFGSVIVLARILGPSEFGEAGVAIVAVNIALLVGEGPMIASVVQAPRIGRAELEIANAVQLVVGLIGAVALLLGADAIAGLFRQPDSVPLVRFVSLIVLVTALNAPSRGVIMRRLDFRLNALTETLPAAIGLLCVAPPLAIAGAGAWSIVMGYFVAGVLELVVTIAVVRPPLKLRWNAPGRKDLLIFSRRIAGINLLNYSLENIDNIIVSRWFGPAIFGAYNRFFGSLRTMSDTYLRSISGAMFPVLSRVDPSDRRHSHRAEQIVGLSAMVTVPAFVSLAFIGPTAVAAIFGPKWQEYADMLPGIAIAVAIFLGPVGVGPLLWARARLRLDLAIQVVGLVAVIAALVLLRQASVVAITWGIAGAYLLRTACFFGAGAYAGGSRPFRLAGAWLIWWPVSAVVGLVAYGIDSALQEEMRAAPRLLVVVVASAFFWAALVRVLNRRLLPRSTFELVDFLPGAAQHAVRLLLGTDRSVT